MIPLTNYDFQWGRSEVVIIYPEIIHIYIYRFVSLFLYQSTQVIFLRARTLSSCPRASARCLARMAAAKPAGPAGTQWIAVEVATFHRFSKTPKSHSSGLVPAKYTGTVDLSLLNAIAVDLAYHSFSPESKQTQTQDHWPNLANSSVSGLQDYVLALGLATHHSQRHKTHWDPVETKQAVLKKGISASHDQEIKPWQRNLQTSDYGKIWLRSGISYRFSLKRSVSVSSVFYDQFWSILQLFHSWLFALPAGTVIPNPGKPLHRLSWDAEVSETASFCLAGQGKSQVLLSFKMFLQRLQQVTDPCRHLHAPQTA